MNEAFLLTGGNTGNRKSHLLRAKQQIEKRCGSILQESSVYETAAWGKEDQDAFLNQVLKIETSLDASSLLTNLLAIEEEMGRKRETKYGPRNIDIDILFFNNDIISLPGLTIPHPQMQHRRFVLEPLNEIAPGKIHPVSKKTVSQLLAQCTDPLPVNKIN